MAYLSFDCLFMYAMWALILWALIWGRRLPPPSPAKAPNRPVEPSALASLVVVPAAIVAGLVTIWAAVLAFCVAVLVALLPIGVIVYLVVRP